MYAIGWWSTIRDAASLLRTLRPLKYVPTSAETGSGYFQETHPQPLFQECSHHCRAPGGCRAVAR
jgi:hypothetical protein